MTWDAEDLALEVELEFAYAQGRAPPVAGPEGFVARRLYTRLWSRPPIQCRTCGACFVPLDARRLYCSILCKGRYHTERSHRAWQDRVSAARAAARGIRRCEDCGETFAPRRSDARYCSELCRGRRAARNYQRRKATTAALKSHRAAARALPLPSPLEVPEVEKSDSGLGGSGCTRSSLRR